MEKEAANLSAVVARPSSSGVKNTPLNPSGLEQNSREELVLAGEPAIAPEAGRVVSVDASVVGNPEDAPVEIPRSQKVQEITGSDAWIRKAWVAERLRRSLNSSGHLTPRVVRLAARKIREKRFRGADSCSEGVSSTSAAQGIRCP
jgi:hypothetical protein